MVAGFHGNETLRRTAAGLRSSSPVALLPRRRHQISRTSHNLAGEPRLRSPTSSSPSPDRRPQPQHRSPPLPTTPLQLPLGLLAGPAQGPYPLVCVFKVLNKKAEPSLVQPEPKPTTQHTPFGPPPPPPPLSASTSVLRPCFLRLRRARPLFPASSKHNPSERIGMGSGGGDVSRILSELGALKASKSDIERRISVLEAQLADINLQNGSLSTASCPPISAAGHGLTPEMIYRYSRHLLLPSFGVEGQSKLVKSSVLVVGAGGLGSPALLYLAACGVGRLGIVDHDVVELNNMHRQVIHTEAYIGQSKVKSAAATCHSINSSIQIVEHIEALHASNALDIMSQYDIVVDATDNAPSRYMISDCCVVLGKPLVSGAAVGLEGQLTVYNYNGGPCYRCLFPTPPPSTACQRCSDSGVLGVVPGVIGCLQALEAIKIASAVGEPLSGRMLLFDALSARIRVVKIRNRSLQCEVCGENAKFTKQHFQEFDYEKFTQTPLSPAPLKLNLLSPESRVSTKEYNERVLSGEAHVLVDVRPSLHYKIVSLPNSLNIPLANLESRVEEISIALKEEEERKGSGAQLYTLCRRGNDSQRAVQSLQKMGFSSVKDIIGGLEAWAREVDPNLPTY